MIKQEFVFSGSKEMPYELHAVIWFPEQKKAEKVLQIAHGMTEHMGRYEELAERLTQEGIVVAGFDLRGHGKNEGNKTCASFGEGGWKCALEDMHLFYKLLKEIYPFAKHYLLGFSLGSFLVREFLSTYSEDKVDGAIIMGTGYQPSIVLSVLMKLIKGQIKKAGWDNTTPFVQQLSFGTYNKKFAPNRTSSDWLCADETSLDEYISDELCRADISSGLFYDLLASMKRTGQENASEDWKKEMPILLLSGKDDPVGDMGKGVEKVYQQFENNGLKNIQFELFEGARHDLLHENKSGIAESVKDLIVNWMLE